MSLRLWIAAPGDAWLQNFFLYAPSEPRRLLFSGKRYDCSVIAGPEAFQAAGAVVAIHDLYVFVYHNVDFP